MISRLQSALTFDVLSCSDLDEIYEKGREELLRDHAFRILLSCKDTINELEKFAFYGEQGLDGWRTKELIEITNHFRLLSSPENEIRLYRECKDAIFKKTPRVLEFYVLALNKAGYPDQAILEGSQIIAEGGQSPLIWSTLGESYSARIFFAEQLEKALRDASGNAHCLDNVLITKLPGYFPEFDLANMTIFHVRELRARNLHQAASIFKSGFRDSGSSFAGLGWMELTLDHLSDVVKAKGRLFNQKRDNVLEEDEEFRLQLLDNDSKSLEEELERQSLLVGIALEIEGGTESLDYWTHAGIVLLTVMKGAGLDAVLSALTRLFSRIDATFKLEIILKKLHRVLDNFTTLEQIECTFGHDTSLLKMKLQCSELAIKECESMLGRLAALEKIEKKTIRKKYHSEVSHDSSDPIQMFLSKTINFRALTSSLVPLNISGGLGRAGSRVPDLLISRQIQNDLIDLVETRILQSLSLEDRKDPYAVIESIQRFVGSGLKLWNLQDLNSPAHNAFDTLSNGLITLSGVDHDMRKNTRSGTDLTASLLLQHGDCRETMYLNGTLFACWQQTQVKKLIAKAMLCLDLNFQEGFQTIVSEEIPSIMRYQMRGGQFMVYVDSIAMRRKYECERLCDNNITALYKPYGLLELRSGVPLTPYELQNAKIEVTYTDGAKLWIEPKDPLTGRWRPLGHVPVPGGGIPLIPDAGNDQEKIRDIKIVNPVEQHAMTFLYDSHEQSIQFCDGFYNEHLFDSPYSFASGQVDMSDMNGDAAMIKAGVRTLARHDGSQRQSQVFLEFLWYSQTDYEVALVEGDIPGTIQLMGRVYRGDHKYERNRLYGGTSPIPALLEKVHRWQSLREQTSTPRVKAKELQLAKLILDMGRKHPDQVFLKEVSSGQPLIVESAFNSILYLVLSGQLKVFHGECQLCDGDGIPVIARVGSILGEISALRGGLASATISGDAVVFGVEMAVVKEQLAVNPEFRCCMEDLASCRVLLDAYTNP